MLSVSGLIALAAIWLCLSLIFFGLSSLALSQWVYSTDTVIDADQASGVQRPASSILPVHSSSTPLGSKLTTPHGITTILHTFRSGPDLAAMMHPTLDGRALAFGEVFSVVRRASP